MKKDKIITILLSVVFSSLIGCATAFAATYLHKANEVSYSNTSSGIASNNVQGAIDNLYTAASNYSAIDTKVDVLERTYSKDTINFRPPTSVNHGGYIDFHYNNSTSDYTSRIIEDTQGRLNFIASNKIRVNNSAPIVLEQKELKASVSANSSKSFDFTFSKSGYTMMGVQKIQFSNTNGLESFRMNDSTTLRVNVRNYTSSATTTTCVVTVLWVKNELIE